MYSSGKVNFLMKVSLRRSKIYMAGGQTCFDFLASSVLPESRIHRRSHSSTWIRKTEVSPLQLSEIDRKGLDE